MVSDWVRGCPECGHIHGHLMSCPRRPTGPADLATELRTLLHNHQVEIVAVRLQQRLDKEASRRNSAYDYFGWDNTPQSVDPDVYAAIKEIDRLTRERDEARARIQTLVALLREVRPHVDGYLDEYRRDERHDTLARIDAALGGGEETP